MLLNFHDLPKTTWPRSFLASRENWGAMETLEFLSEIQNEQVLWVFHSSSFSRLAKNDLGQVVFGKSWKRDGGNIGISKSIFVGWGRTTVVATARGNDTALGRMRAARGDLPWSTDGKSQHSQAPRAQVSRTLGLHEDMTLLHSPLLKLELLRHGNYCCTVARLSLMVTL